MSLARTISALILFLFGWVGSASALECGEDEPFACLKSNAKKELGRLYLPTNDYQDEVLDALTALDSYYFRGPQAATKAWEERGLPLETLLTVLLLADRYDDAVKVARAATKPLGIEDNDGNQLTGEAAVIEQKDYVDSLLLNDFEDWPYAYACTSDSAFGATFGGKPAMRRGACFPPYDLEAVQTTFELLQLIPGLNKEDPFDVAMQYAHRVGSCDIATTVLRASASHRMLAEDKDSAAWKVVDVATVCAADLIKAKDL